MSLSTEQFQLLTKHNTSLLSVSQLHKLTTERLLAYLKKHRWLRGIGICSCCGSCITEQDQLINDAAHQYVDEIRTILNTRPHSAKAHRNAKPKPHWMRKSK